MKHSLNLPNRITVARLGLAIVFFVLVGQYSHRAPRPWLLDLAAATFVIAAISDILDGYIARKRGLVTPFGRILDPLVDKILVCGAFILFVGTGFVDADGHNVTEVRTWMVVVIVGRELLVTGLRGFNESMGKAFGASLHGKIKMWMQSVAAPAILLIVAHEGTWFSVDKAQTMKITLAWLTVVVTAVSMGQYLMRSRYILEEGTLS
ncbi:MAG: CDP-diacylglycerol--glycerol-3-phosphate 3-phosphatidyltransferase [Planctomycetes bacterium]|nr:CDP-diacylglycerol--glycerol-3-phosphate 3-phosphatidyltransferase [Planctomycetota bacterium]